MKQPTKPHGKAYVALDRGLIKNVRCIANSMDMSVPEFIHAKLTAVVAAELPAAIAAMQAATK